MHSPAYGIHIGMRARAFGRCTSAHMGMHIDIRARAFGCCTSAHMGMHIDMRVRAFRLCARAHTGCAHQHLQEVPERPALARRARQHVVEVHSQHETYRKVDEQPGHHLHATSIADTHFRQMQTMQVGPTHIRQMHIATRLREREVRVVAAAVAPAQPRLGHALGNAIAPNSRRATGMTPPKQRATTKFKSNQTPAHSQRSRQSGCRRP